MQAATRMKNRRDVVKSPRRKDPETRPVQFADWTRVKNKDPERVYVLASTLDQNSGVGLYLMLGYEVELHRAPGEPGPRFELFVPKPEQVGQPMENMGHVLMSKPREAYEDEYMNGGLSGPGQALADHYEKRIGQKNGFVDPIRNNLMRTADLEESDEAAFGGEVENG